MIVSTKTRGPIYRRRGRGILSGSLRRLLVFEAGGVRMKLKGGNMKIHRIDFVKFGEMIDLLRA
jgi:hypothetical protein